MQEGLIAFANLAQDGSLSIFLADVQGQVVRQLTHERSRDWFPAWSPDGKSIAYTSDRGSAQHTYGVDLGDYSLVELSDEEVAAREFPDRGPFPLRTGVAQVWMMDADGSRHRQLTCEGANAHPAWSLDGEQIAFSSTRSGKLEIHLMAADGSSQKQLTHSPSEGVGPFEGLRLIELAMHGLYSPDVKGPANLFPTWSPDGRQIGFCSIGQDNYAIWVMDLDSGHLTRLTYPYGDHFPQANCPAWSPKGDQIAFWSGVNVGPGSIWVINADGSDRQKVSDEPDGFICDEPSWSADGTRILYTTNRTDEREGVKSGVWITDPDGENQRPFVRDAVPGFNRASWRPVSPQQSGQSRTNLNARVP